jgi:hypothetical protein
MDPKNNFINSKPSIVTNNEAERAENLATTDDELELGNKNTDLKTNGENKKSVTNKNYLAEKESLDPGADEEA